MRTMQYQNAGYRIGLAPNGTKQASGRARVPADWLAATMDALSGVEDVVSSQGVANPDTLTHYGITAYALALMRLRECASAGRFERLTDACDALAVTVSRLIEDRNCASSEKCEALKRFVAHAQAIIQMSVVHPASGNVHVKHGARSSR